MIRLVDVFVRHRTPHKRSDVRRHTVAEDRVLDFASKQIAGENVSSVWFGGTATSHGPGQDSWHGRRLS